VDQFEETILSMTGMSSEDRAESDKKFGALCMCPACPTYNRCAGNAQELLFCLMGKSFLCISDEKGCICPTCPVTTEFGFRHLFFCRRGNEKAQRYEHGLWGTKMI
jgi:hypothetical protein